MLCLDLLCSAVPSKAMRSENCFLCAWRGANAADGHWCTLWGGVKKPETPCPDPKWRDVMLQSRRLKEGKYDPV